MQTLADEVGGLMAEIMAASPLITREAAALTAALSICDDCHKNADRAAALAERVEELEVAGEIWQEEKVDLLRSNLDTQKDVNLSEKAARLESENTRLESDNARMKEALETLSGVEREVRALRDENKSLRQAASAPTPQEQSLRQENAQLRESLEKLSDAAKQNGDAYKLAERRLQENQALQAQIDRLTKALEASQASQEPADARPAAPRRSRSRKNPLRQDSGEIMEQEGFQSFFAKPDDSIF